MGPLHVILFNPFNTLVKQAFKKSPGIYLNIKQNKYSDTMLDTEDRQVSKNTPCTDFMEIII